MCGSAHGANLASPGLPRLRPLGKHERHPSLSSPRLPIAAEAAPTASVRLLNLQGNTQQSTRKIRVSRAANSAGTLDEWGRGRDRGNQTPLRAHLGDTARRWMQRRGLAGAARAMEDRRARKRACARRRRPGEGRARRGGAAAAPASGGREGGHRGGGGEMALGPRGREEEEIGEREQSQRCSPLFYSFFLFLFFIMLL